MLARAAAKGLLGGIIPEQSKTSKKGKSRKNRVASAGSKPSSPSSQETGRELVNGEDPDPVAPSEHEEKKGECGEEGEEEKAEEKEEDKGGKGETKRGKGSKRKVKRRPKQTSTVLKHHPKGHKKKSTKRKVGQSHHKRRITRNKPRRIPRLTLTLISSAKPSNHLSPIAALAHKLRNNATIKSQQTDFSAPSPAPRPKQVQRHNTEPERAEKTLKEAAKPESSLKARGKVVRAKKELVTEDDVKPAGFVLPPIFSPSPSSSVSSRSSSSLCQRPLRTSHSQLAQISASSVSLPGL